MSTYKIVLVPEPDGGFSVLVPALPGCYSQGEMREQAIEMAKEAIGLHIESMREQGEAIPQGDIEIIDVQIAPSAA